MKDLFHRLLILTGVLLFCIPGMAQRSISDTSFLFFFEVNMTKAIQEGIFDPDSDQVFVDFQDTIPDLELISGPFRCYSALLLQELDSGRVYTFNFRINDTIHEDIDRQATAQQGTLQIRSWWNDEYLNTTTFRINAAGIPFYHFTHGRDHLQITGEMNQWEPQDMVPVDSTKIYEATFHLDPTRYYEYVFRIQTDSSVQYEKFYGRNRLFLPPPDTAITMIQYFNNEDTGKIAMNFYCHMNIQEQLGQFHPDSQYLDMAGNFNDWGGWDLLYDYYDNGLYQQTLLFDKSMIGVDTLEFKFRIEGSWDLAELQGENPRTHILQPVDTTGNPNFVDAWYNNEGPVVPTPPWVSDVFIQGLLEVKQILSGSYQYHNLSGIPEGQSLYQWYRADSVGGPLQPIDSANTINYTTDSLADLGKYLVFEVTPVAASGDSAIGQPVQVYTTGPIGQVGIPEWARIGLQLYPNPATAEVKCVSNHRLDRLEIMSLDGRIIKVFPVSDGYQVQVNVSALPSGMYLIRAFGKDVLPGIQRLIKQ